MLKKTALFFILVSCSVFSHAQLTKPSLDTVSVGWGWFYMRLGNQSIKPTTVDWYVFDPAKPQIVFRSLCDPKASAECLPLCNGDYSGDTKDIREKLIIGCKGNYHYRIKARYTDGFSWSPWSDSLEVFTPPEPQYTDPEYGILVWGNSLVKYGDQCNFVSTTRLGEEETLTDDNFCHALQTELRRLTNRNIKVINEGEAESRQSDWIQNHSQKYQTTYAEHSRYKMALFFFGANDAANHYPVSSYKSDIESIANLVAGFKTKTVFHSIHYTSDPNFVSAQDQTNYRTAWTSKMDELLTKGDETSKYIYKGMDLHQLFSFDPERFLGVDGIHPDLTEGMHDFIHRLGPFIENIINNDKTQTRNPELPHAFTASLTEDNCIHLMNTTPDDDKYILKVISSMGVVMEKVAFQNSNELNNLCLHTIIPRGIYFLNIQSTDRHQMQTIRLVH